MYNECFVSEHIVQYLHKKATTWLLCLALNLVDTIASKINVTSKKHKSSDITWDPGYTLIFI